MEDEKKEDTFELPPEPEVKAQPATPTRTELKEKGWSASEMDAAEKRGMVDTPEARAKKEADTKAKADAETKAKSEADAKAKADADAKAKAEGRGKEGDEGGAKKKFEIKPSSLPDFTFKTPEQEKAFLDAFGPGTPQRAMYFRMKNERSARQSEKLAREAAEKRAAELEAENKVLRAGKETPEPEVDAEGNVIDPEEKPLTLKQLNALRKQEAEEIAKKERELTDKARVVADAQKTQEEYAQSIYPDFDETVTKAKDLINNLETLVPDRWKQTKIVKLIRDLQIAAANADKLDLDEYHASIIAYEIGQMHPDYGKKADETRDENNGGDADKDGKRKDPSKANGGQKLTPEQMKRIEENTQRRTSSASVKGGEKRTITVADVDLSTLNKMTYTERQRFREKHPDEYAKLVRG